jgi:thioesterase domain-containing protein
MIPSAFVFLDSLPITPNGKVDRKGLPALTSTRPLTEESYVAPRDVLELQLAQIWERVLGIQPIGVTDNFFDLGGHSLLAAGLMARIWNLMKRELPLSALFQGGTIESLAAILRREAGSMSWSCLVELQAAGSRPPLFFAHPGGGNVLCYLDLSRCLGPDQPFYGFQTPGLYGERTLYTRIEDLATHYIEAMKTIQPEGPYFVGGWSLGGIVAYEMAQQLISRGQEVGRLLLLDSGAWALGEERLAADEGPGEIDDALQLIRLFAESLSISKEELGQFEGDQRIEYVLKRAAAENLIPPAVDVAQARSFLNVYRVNVRAMRKYTPRVYPGAVTLLKTSMGLIRTPADGSARSEQIAKMVQDPTMGWGELAAGGVQVVEVTGNHQTMMKRPHVEILALNIKTCLNGNENIDL